MKHLFLLFAVTTLCLFSACSNFEEPCTSLLKTNKIKSIRSYDEAFDIAMDATKMLDERDTRANTKRIIDNDKSIVITGKMTRSSNDIDTLMYIFNYENNEGYSVISANPNTPDLIAITEKGYYDPNVKSDNEALDLYMQMAMNMIIIDPPTWNDYDTIPTFTSRFGESEIVEEGIPAKINLRWGQQTPYGNYYSNQNCGCVQTAEAMIMAYYKHPQSIVLSFLGDNAPIQNINWDLVNEHKSTTECNDYAQLGDSIIARLCRQIGYLNNSVSDIYPVISTNVTIANTFNALREYGYHCTEFEEYEGLDYKTELKDHNAICMVSAHTSTAHGHCFLIDGYKDRIRRMEIFDVYNVVNQNGVVINQVLVPSGIDERIQEEYVHINWGWNGNDNGYFLKGTFNPMYWSILDEGCQDQIYWQRNYCINVRFSFISL